MLELLARHQEGPPARTRDGPTWLAQQNPEPPHPAATAAAEPRALPAPPPGPRCLQGCSVLRLGSWPLSSDVVPCLVQAAPKRQWSLTPGLAPRGPYLQPLSP